MPDHRARGGTIAGVTAERRKDAHRAKKRLQLAFDSYAAPSHQLARKYGLTVSPDERYPHGLVQASVVVVHRDALDEPWFVWTSSDGYAPRVHPEELLDTVVQKMQEHRRAARGDPKGCCSVM